VTPLGSGSCCLRPPVYTPRLPDLLGTSVEGSESLLPLPDLLEDSVKGPSDLRELVRDLLSSFLLMFSSAWARLEV